MLFEINGTWDKLSLDQADRFVAFRGSYDIFLDRTAKELADYAVEYIKPMLNVRNNPRGNGDTAASIQSSISQSDEGFDIDFNGLLSAYYMDVGNFPPGEVLDAASYGFKAFPVDQRFGNPNFQRTIHGMGSFTPGVPTHWSEKTATHMAEDGIAIESAMKYFSEFLSEVVIT